MPPKFYPKIATSNHLLEGDVIYFSRPNWTRSMSQATVAETKEDADQLLIEASQYSSETVDVVLIDVEISTGAPRPVQFREELRTKGPSNYFHGKQAEHV